MTTRNPFENLEGRIEARRAEVEGSSEAALAGLATRVEERRSEQAPIAIEILDDLAVRVDARRAQVEGEPTAAERLASLDDAVEARRSETG